ncbi:MAG: ABC transporter ATP-binding protein [Proteobacteria bacterium]|nr:ABC transporter ATP-binding protein [Pseudomonadota bacterium]
MSSLAIERLCHAFGRQVVLRDVAFTVWPGEVVCLLGPSGCGKTTLLRLLAGLERLQAGRIQIGETVVADDRAGIDLPPERRSAGLMFQDYALFPHLTVYGNVAFGLPGSEAERQRWVADALMRVGLTGSAEKYPHELSGGQQQRVALLRALAPRPSVLLLDEPFSGLDIMLRAQVREETLDLLKEQRLTALMVTHDPEEAMFIADRILVMDEGRIVQTGTPLETYFKPANAFVAGHFGPCNLLTGRVVDGRVETPLGTFAAAHLADGEPVQVMIRPEGLLLQPCASPHASGHRVRVATARLIGRSSILRLRCQVEGGPDLLLQARVPGTFIPDEGTPVMVTVDMNRAHVFSREPGEPPATDLVQADA